MTGRGEAAGPRGGAWAVADQRARDVRSPAITGADLLEYVSPLSRRTEGDGYINVRTLLRVIDSLGPTDPYIIAHDPL